MKTQHLQTIEEYIGNFPKDVQKPLRILRSAIKKLAPGAKEVISYGIPTFKLNGNLVHFAGFKTHIGFYPTPSPIAHFKKELAKYSTSKGTIRFPLNKPLPMPLITKIVKFRLKQNIKKEINK